MIEVVNKISNGIGTRVDFLADVQRLNFLDNDDLVIKKSIHTILHAVAERYSGTQFSIYTKGIAEVTTPADFTRLELAKLEDDDTAVPPHYQQADPTKKIKIVAIDFKFTLNSLELFGTFRSPAKTIKGLNSFWVVSPLYAIVYPLVAQPFNREPTTISNQFVEKIKPILETEFQINHSTLEITTTLVQLELGRLATEFQDIQSEAARHPGLGESCADILEARALITKLANLRKQQDYKRQVTEEKIKAIIRDTTTASPTVTTVGEYMALHQKTQEILWR